MDILAKEKQKAEAELGERTKALVAHGRAYGMPVGDGERLADKYNATTTRLATMADTLTAAHRAGVEALAAHLEVAQTTLADPKKAAAVADLVRTGGARADDVTRLRAEAMQLDTKLREMRQRFLPGHPMVSALQSELEQLDNVILTPHVAGQSRRVPARHLQVLLDNLRHFARGEAVENVVDKSRWF